MHLDRALRHDPNLGKSVHARVHESLHGIKQLATLALNCVVQSSRRGGLRLSRVDAPAVQYTPERWKRSFAEHGEKPPEVLGIDGVQAHGVICRFVITLAGK